MVAAVLRRVDAVARRAFAEQQAGAAQAVPAELPSTTVEPAASETQVCRVGGELVEGRIDRDPQPASAAFVDVDLGPGMVVERALDAADIREADGNTRRNAE